MVCLVVGFKYLVFVDGLCCYAGLGFDLDVIVLLFVFALVLFLLVSWVNSVAICLV